MKKNFLFLLIFVLSAVFAANSAEAAKGVIKTGNSGGMTSSITIIDLGIENPGTLPTSRLYFLKEWRRGITRIFTFNSIAKAELELKIANEKAAEALKVKEDNPLDAPEALAIALENYTKAGERLQARLAKLKETSQNPNVDALLTKLVDRLVKHEQLFDEIAARHGTIEDILPSGISEEGKKGPNAVNVKLAKQGVIKTIATASEKDEPKKFATRVEKAVSALRGDELKYLRAVELVEHFQKNASKEVKAQLEMVREGFFDKLSEDIARLYSVTGQPTPVGEKIRQLPGDSVRHLIILDEIKESVMFNPKEYSITKANAKKALNQIIEDIDKAVREHTDIKQKAEEQIMRAEETIQELESELARISMNIDGQTSKEYNIAIPDDQAEKTGPIRLDPTPARISTNMTIERQTPKTDFGDRMKAGLDTAGGALANAKAFFAEGKFGEAFGKARTAEVLARNRLRLISNSAKQLIREGVDADVPRVEDMNSAMPIVPGTGKAGKKIVPEIEKRVFPETNNRVFPETNNRTACDDRQAPGCLRGEILECRSGKWVCIGQATGSGINAQTPAAITGQKQIEIKPTVEQTPVVREKTVVYNDTGYSPSALSIKKGETVIFKNQSSRSTWPASAMHPTHRVYSEIALDEHCPDISGMAFDACTGILPSGSWKFTFNKVGTWKYHDHLNPTNYGAVVVE